MEVRNNLEIEGREALVILTDDPEAALLYRKNNICCIGLGRGDRYFEGVEFVLESADDANEEYLKRAWCHFHHLPYTVFREDDLICRESVLEDYDDLAGMSEGNNFVHFPEREVYEAYIETGYRLYGYGLWTVLIRTSRGWERAGWCGIMPPQEDGEEEFVRYLYGGNDADSSFPQLGFVIRPDLRGRGTAKKACRGLLAYAKEQLGLSALEIRTGADNEAAAKLALSLGFRGPQP